MDLLTLKAKDPFLVLDKSNILASIYITKKVPGANTPLAVLQRFLHVDQLLGHLVLRLLLLLLLVLLASSLQSSTRHMNYQ